MVEGGGSRAVDSCDIYSVPENQVAKNLLAVNVKEHRLSAVETTRDCFLLFVVVTL